MTVEKIKILNWKKQTVEEMDLPAFLRSPAHPSLLHEVLRWHRARLRQGTHQAKTRAFVRGGGKKPFRQKGTGRARQGSSRSPLNEGGGVTFGPKPRDYSYSLPVKIRKAGLRQALVSLWKDGKLMLVQDMKSEKGKTKELFFRLKTLGLKKALLVDEEGDALFKRATGNLSCFHFLPLKGLNAYQALKYGSLVLSRRGFLALSSKFEEQESKKREDKKENSRVLAPKNQAAKGQQATKTVNKGSPQ